jgi:hypothetical protein
MIAPTKGISTVRMAGVRARGSEHRICHVAAYLCAELDHHPCMSAHENTESVLAQTVAGRLLGGVPVMGGTLALTASRLVFLPLVSRGGLGRSNGAAKLGERVHSQVDHDYVSPQRLLNAAIKPLAVRIEVPLAQIQTVTPTRRYALLVAWVDAGKPKNAEFAVAASRFSPGWNPQNVTARDRFLAELTRRIPRR